MYRMTENIEFVGWDEANENAWVGCGTVRREETMTWLASSLHASADWLVVLFVLAVSG